jgi:DNA-binding NarL/FixJ family response regulator
LPGRPADFAAWKTTSVAGLVPVLAAMRAPENGGTIRRMRPTVLIVDDHDDFRASARALLELQGFDVVADVQDGERAIAATRRLHPDVVLLDVQLPGMDGFEVAERLSVVEPPPRVVLVSSRKRAAYDGRLPDAPVAGFLGKDELSGAALAALL